MNKNKILKSMLIIGALATSVFSSSVVVSAGGIASPKLCRAGGIASPKGGIASPKGGIASPKVCKAASGIASPK